MMMKNKIISSIIALSIFSIVLLGAFRLRMNNLNSESKVVEVKQITSEYLKKAYSDCQFEIVDGPNKVLAFGKYDIKLQDRNNNLITLKIDDKLNFIDDSIQNKTLGDKLNIYLKVNFNKKFPNIKGEVIANIDIKDRYSSRKDNIYIDIIDKKQITKREFADITEEVLKWINSNEFQLNLLYVDYKHKEESEYVYSIKIDKENIIKKDLIPYIETIFKR